jgi:hypothetical protein
VLSCKIDLIEKVPPQRLQGAKKHKDTTIAANLNAQPLKLSTCFEQAQSVSSE